MNTQQCSSHLESLQHFITVTYLNNQSYCITYLSSFVSVMYINMRKIKDDWIMDSVPLCILNHLKKVKLQNF